MSGKGDLGAGTSASRWSVSAEAARQAEFARVLAMSPLERMALALSLGRRRLELARRRRESPPMR